MTNLPVYKLYAVGTYCPHPDMWNYWDEVAIVIARNKEEASELGEDAICVEIQLDRPVVLMKMPPVDIE